MGLGWEFPSILLGSDGPYFEKHGNPLQYSCLENPMDGRAWWATVHRVTKSRTRLNDLTFSRSKWIHLHDLAKGTTCVPPGFKDTCMAVHRVFSPVVCGMSSGHILFRLGSLEPYEDILSAFVPQPLMSRTLRRSRGPHRLPGLRTESAHGGRTL